jgi:hypothetical protein
VEQLIVALALALRLSPAFIAAIALARWQTLSQPSSLQTRLRIGLLLPRVICGSPQCLRVLVGVPITSDLTPLKEAVPLEKMALAN